MKRRYKLMLSVKGSKFAGFCALFLFTLILSLGGYNFTLEAAIPQKNMLIEYKSGKVSAKLKDVQIKEVLEDIAKNTGIEFVGLDKITGTIEELEFSNLSLEDAIRTLVEKSILIFRKEGPQEEEMKIKKVIFIAQMEEEKKEPPTPLPPPPPIKRTPPPKPPIPPKPVTPPTPPQRPTPPSRPTPPPPPPPPRPPRPTRPKPPPKPSVPPPKAPEPKPTPPKKPAPATVKPKPVSKPKTQDANLRKGLKNYKEKRWDRAIKYLNIYLKSNPGDKEIGQKIAQARKNTKDAISSYKSGKAAEKAGNYQQAYKFYKNSYELYPLLYDTWERMQKMKKRL